MRKALLGIAALLLMTSLGHANETGTVRFAYGQYGAHAGHPGHTFFHLEGGTRVNKPGCGSADGGERWVINNAWPAAKLQLTVLLAAAFTGKRVQVLGTSDCGVWGDTETVLMVHVVPD